MNDNVLKKEFSKKDVQRARNLVTGNTGARVTEGIGYTKKHEHHEEGEVWEESGRKWTIKNGIKQNITKMDKFKKMGKIPLFCPECNTLMKKELDKKVYPAYQKCFDCIVDYEAELQKQGKLEEHFTSLRNNHIDSAISGYESFMKDQLNQVNSNAHLVTEAGDVESWKGGISREELEHQLQEGLEFLKNMKDK
jgi:hypothetical protein